MEIFVNELLEQLGIKNGDYDDLDFKVSGKSFNTTFQFVNELAIVVKQMGMLLQPFLIDLSRALFSVIRMAKEFTRSLKAPSDEIEIEE